MKDFGRGQKEMFIHLETEHNGAGKDIYNFIKNTAEGEKNKPPARGKI